MEATSPIDRAALVHSVVISASQYQREVIVSAVGGTVQGSRDLARLTHYEHASGVRIIKTNDFVIIARSFSLEQRGVPHNQFQTAVFEQQSDDFSTLDFAELASEPDVFVGIAVSVRRKTLSRAKETSFLAQVSRILRKYERRITQNSWSSNCAVFAEQINEECGDLFFQQLGCGNFEQNVFARDRHFSAVMSRQFGGAIDWNHETQSAVIAQVFNVQQCAIQPQAPLLLSPTPARPDPDDMFDDILSLNERTFTYRLGGKYFDTPTLFYGGIPFAEITALTRLCRLAEYEIATTAGTKKARFSDADIAESIDLLSEKRWLEFFRTCVGAIKSTGEKLVIIGIAPLANIICRTIALFCSQFAQHDVTYAYPRNALPRCGDASTAVNSQCTKCGRMRHYFVPLVSSLTAINGKYCTMADEVLFDILEEGYCVIDAISGEAFTLKGQKTLKTFRQKVRRVTSQPMSNYEFGIESTCELLSHVQQAYLLYLARGE